MFLPIKSKKKILALGSEFDTRLAFYHSGEIIFSENTGELVENKTEYEKFVMDFVETHCNVSLRMNPDVIITDLHPLYNSRKIGEKLAMKWNIPHYSVQHHIAHIFSAIADWTLENGPSLACPAHCGERRQSRRMTGCKGCVGIACDGTGYGLDGNIWGGEVFRICKNIIRIGHLEEQYLLGGELAIEEPARMVISILSKILSQEEVFKYVEKYYSAQEFNFLWNQREKKFNCPLTTSAGRVLDAVSIFLGFCENERKYKHYSVKMLENYTAGSCGKEKFLKPKIIKNKNGEYILDTTYLFEYLVKNTPLAPPPTLKLWRTGLNRRTKKEMEEQKKKLGAAAQRYIIEGLYEIAGKDVNDSKRKIFFAGGLAKNEVMKKFAEDNNIYISKNIPSGDAGIAAGQIMYYLLNHQ
ncbi:MAG: hypothetical protein V1860_00050 [bacterium]